METNKQWRELAESKKEKKYVSIHVWRSSVGGQNPLKEEKKI